MGNAVVLPAASADELSQLAKGFTHLDQAISVQADRIEVLVRSTSNFDDAAAELIRLAKA